MYISQQVHACVHVLLYSLTAISIDGRIYGVRLLSTDISECVKAHPFQAKPSSIMYVRTHAAKLVSLPSCNAFTRDISSTRSNFRVRNNLGGIKFTVCSNCTEPDFFNFSLKT